MRVYVHGNCQAPIIAAMIAEQYPSWQVDSYEVFNQSIIQEADRYHAVVRSADVIFSQPVQDGYRGRADLSLNWIRQMARPHAMILTFPSMFFDGQLVGWRSVGVPAYGMDYHDMLLFHLTAQEISEDMIIKILLDKETYPHSFIVQEINLAISEMQRREQGEMIDIPISPFLRRYAFSTQLFHITNHPCRPALANVATELLRCLGCPAPVPPAGRHRLVYPHVPLSPAVEKFLAAGGSKPTDWPAEDQINFHVPEGIFSRTEYWSRAIKHLRRFGEAEMTSLLNGHTVRPFLARLAAASPSIPGIAIWRDPQTPQ